jgi:hypothetical protein
VAEKKHEIFPGLPDDLVGLGDDELRELIAKHEDILSKVRDQKYSELMTEEQGATLSLRDILDQSKAGAEEIKRLRSEVDARVSMQEEFSAELRKIADDAGLADREQPTVEEPAEEPVAEAEPVQEPEQAPEAEPVEAEAEAEPVAEVAEPVAASAALERRPLPRVQVKHQPKEIERQGIALLAAAGIPGFSDSALIETKHDLATAMIRKREQHTSTKQGVSEKVIVASADYGDQYPEERNLTTGNPMAKIENVVAPWALGVNPDTGGEALLASGGLCAPVAPYYDLLGVETAARPVRDALATFMAGRGGINAGAPPTIADVTGVGIKTEAEDAAGGTFATKECQVVACPAFTETFVDMVYRCLQFGNLNARAWPELVARWTDLSIAAHARTAETNLLDGIGAASTAVTEGQEYGAVSDLIGAILKAAAGMRSRHRMDATARFRAILPAWILDLLSWDLVNQQFGRFEFTRDGVIALLRRYGVEPSFTLDGETGEGQVFGAQSAGDLLGFPVEVVWYIFPEGSFLFLDAGELNLGIVRDSVLNSTNDYQIFAETFENVAYVGVESLKVTSVLCPNGEVAAPTTAFTCTT